MLKTPTCRAGKTENGIITVIQTGIQIKKSSDKIKEELKKAVEEKVIELAGPQKSGYGLDRRDIDDLLASL
jgi:anaerobic ribonucleoside-triphosphate reductase